MLNFQWNVLMLDRISDFPRDKNLCYFLHPFVFRPAVTTVFFLAVCVVIAESQRLPTSNFDVILLLVVKLWHLV